MTMHSLNNYFDDACYCVPLTDEDVGVFERQKQRLGDVLHMHLSSYYNTTTGTTSDRIDAAIMARTNHV